MLRRGRTSKSKPASSCCRRRKVSRTRRFSRFRSTARRATRLLTTIPRRENRSPFRDACTRKRSLLAMRRERKSRPNESPPDKRARRWKASDRKPLAALRAAAIEDLPTTQSFHAGPEAMRVRTADLRRLISAFHRDSQEEMGKSWLLDGGATTVVKSSRNLWITLCTVVECQVPFDTENFQPSS